MENQLIEQICNMVFNAMSTEEKLMVLRPSILALLDKEPTKLDKEPTNTSIRILTPSNFTVIAAKIIHNTLDISLKDSKDIVDNIPTTISNISMTKAKMLQERLIECGIKSEIL